LLLPCETRREERQVRRRRNALRGDKRKRDAIYLTRSKVVEFNFLYQSYDFEEQLNFVYTEGRSSSKNEARFRAQLILSRGADIDILSVAKKSVKIVILKKRTINFKS
jgi:hypothetical protein